VSMRRRARHRPEGQGIARTCLELFLCDYFFFLSQTLFMSLCFKALKAHADKGGITFGIRPFPSRHDIISPARRRRRRRGRRRGGANWPRIVENPVPPDETQTAQDELERHEVVRRLSECSSGNRTPDVPRFSSDSVTIRPQRPVREGLV